MKKKNEQHMIKPLGRFYVAMHKHFATYTCIFKVLLNSISNIYMHIYKYFFQLSGSYEPQARSIYHEKFINI